MNKRMIAAWFAGMLAMLVWTSVGAVKLTTLYEVSVPVASQAAEARTEAIHTAFQDVLIRLTGDQNIVKNKQIKPSLERADYFVQEFSYSAPEVSDATYTLNVKFSEQDVKRLLRKVGAKQWTNIRPLVLVWLATVDGQEASIIGIEGNNLVLQKFKQQGQRYGLPLIFPVMDVTDLSQISPDNITRVSLPEIKSASKRYEPDALLIGTIEMEDGTYQARWNLISKDKSWDWTTSGNSQDQVIGDALDHISQMFSQNRAMRASNG